jgi:hypothetical protein
MIQDGTSMALQYTDTTITSDATHHTARLLIPEANVWSLSWTPGMFRFRQAEDAVLLAEAVGQVVPLNGHNDAWRRIDEYAEQLGMSGTDAMLRVVAADRHSQASRAAQRCLQQDPPGWFNHRYRKRSAERIADDGGGVFERDAKGCTA